MVDVDTAGERLIVITEKVERFGASLVTLCQPLLRIVRGGVFVFNLPHQLASHGIDSHRASRRKVGKEDFIRSFGNHSPVRNEVGIWNNADSIQISTDIVGDERLAAGIEQQFVAILRGADPAHFNGEYVSGG